MKRQEDTDDAMLDAYIAAAAALNGLAIAPEWHDAIRTNMKTLAAAAALLHDEPLDDHVEAAPIFTP